MSRPGAALLVPAVLAFVASAMLYACQAAPAIQPQGQPVIWLSAEPAPIDLADLFLRPRDPGMAAFLGAVWLALIYHAARRLFERLRLRRATAVPSTGPDPTLRESGPLLAGLLAGAIWPWLLRDHPLPAVLLAGLMLAGFLAAALRGVDTGTAIRRSSTLGFVAG